MKEVWYQKTWRPILAFVFAFVVIMDFIIMPHIIYKQDNIKYNQQVIELAKQFDDSNVQREIIASMSNKKLWQPLTLSDGAGMFYIAFGAVLTGAALTRTREINNASDETKGPYST